MRNNPINNTDPTGHYCTTYINGNQCVDSNGSVSTVTQSSNVVLPVLPLEDDTWGSKSKKDRYDIVKSLLAKYKGPKWWTGSLPTSDEWAAFLMGEEGGVLKNENDKITLTQIILYKIITYPDEPGVEFTPVTNPVIDTPHELNNFTSADFAALINPDKGQLQKGFELVAQVDTTKKPDYLYFVDETEMKHAGVSIGDFAYGYHVAPTYPGASGNNYMVFLQAYEDFQKVFP